MDEAAPKPLSSVARALLGLGAARLELLEVELQEEKFQLINLLIILAVSASLAIAGVVILVAVLGVYFVRIAGYPAVAGLGAFLLLSAVVLVFWAKRKLLHGALPFAETINEFKKDASCLNLND